MYFYLGLFVGFCVAAPGFWVALLLVQATRTRREQEGVKLYPDPLPLAAYKWREPALPQIQGYRPRTQAEIELRDAWLAMHGDAREFFGVRGRPREDEPTGQHKRSA